MIKGKAISIHKVYIDQNERCISRGKNTPKDDGSRGYGEAKKDTGTFKEVLLGSQELPKGGVAKQRQDKEVVKQVGDEVIENSRFGKSKVTIQLNMEKVEQVGCNTIGYYG